MVAVAEARRIILDPAFIKAQEKREEKQGINRDFANVANDELRHLLEYMDEQFEADEISKKLAEVVAVKVGHYIGHGTEFTRPLFNFVVKNNVVPMEERRLDSESVQARRQSRDPNKSDYLYFPSADGLRAYSALAYCYLQLLVPKKVDHGHGYMLVPGPDTFKRVVPETRTALGEDHKLALLLNDPPQK